LKPHDKKGKISVQVPAMMKAERAISRARDGCADRAFS
jgi:hypothetical protein